MSRTISQLTEGTMVYIDETVSSVTTHTPYIYLGLDEGGNARLLRQYVAVQRRMNATDVASYSGCEADVWLENETDGFLSRLDAATINALAQTSIKYVDYTLSEEPQVVTIARRCFPLSYTEEGWAATAAGSEGKSYLNALKTFYDTTNDNTARIGYTESQTAVNVWMRSALSSTQFRYINSNGSALSVYASFAGFWLRPALSVAPATLVSDEGADAIFLLPDGRKTYWELIATASMGKTASRPKKAKLFNTHDQMSLLAYKLCNNYGDTEPTWENASENGVTTFANTSKTADSWELGVKIEAHASSTNKHIGEPTVIVEFDE